MEGARCVHDPVRTFKGITNGTYNAWRRDSGAWAGDVCRDLTEQQAEAIYYQRYWLASGADRLSSATAIAVFDHAVNAGVGSAKGLFAQCGDNANCVIQALRRLQNQAQLSAVRAGLVQPSKRHDFFLETGKVRTHGDDTE